MSESQADELIAVLKRIANALESRADADGPASDALSYIIEQKILSFLKTWPNDGFNTRIMATKALRYTRGEIGCFTPEYASGFDPAKINWRGIAALDTTHLSSAQRRAIQAYLDRSSGKGG